MRRRTLLLVLALAAGTLAGNPARSDVVVDDPTGVIASPNVHLRSHIEPLGTPVGGHFMGRYFFLTAARSGTFLPGNAGTGGVYAFDATAPETPKLVGFLPLPHWENEDVDISAERKFLLVTAERTRISQCEANSQAAGIGRENCSLPPMLYVVDISDPANMKVRSQLEMPKFAGKMKNGTPLRGPGHTATCILGCRYAYISSSRFNQGVYVIDLRNLDAPRIHGQVWNSPAGIPNAEIPEKGMVHDVNVDRLGNVWFVGTGGTAMYAPVKDPLRPRLVAYGKAIDDKYNRLIHHGSLRLNSSMVMVNEEDYASQCGYNRNAVDEVLRDDTQQGSFQIWRIAGSKLVPVSSWKTEADEYAEGGNTVILSCSAHWFSINRHNVVAVAWYGQGVRFLDVSNPRSIKQVGYYLGAASEVSAAYFVPWRPDIVYSVDYDRGLDVLQIDGGGRQTATVVAPMRAEWFADYAGVRFAPALRPDPDWGYACARPASLDG